MPNLGCNKLKLSEHEYFKTFGKGFAREQIGFISEASRECNIVMMSLLKMVDMFMELNKWLGLYSGMITEAKLNAVISIGDTSSYNGAMQVIFVEFRALSLVVPTRECDFLRYCRKLNDETWVVVDALVYPCSFMI
ncbi:hypothetical protein M9H77_19342 [Catharanthus roseus]|uniref:Uncharacterized protein n=1 Tax=Catharanthus roseus TaxID=4058 RepID=A0ACC0BA36_CATRO|nr:hypothetical protein M9H77_19342 [Catharanthus roseus]